MHTGGEAALRHPLLENNDFERLRRNDVLELRPHILHFGGFSLHQEHSQVLRILNVSASSTNMKIIGPATQWFKITYEKKGLLAPGMSEDVTVTFTPHEWRYYYDTIKIFCGDQADNLIVPIHAYPAANDVTLPRIIDFGRVPIGATRTRTVPLTCKIPIQFEYEFTLIEEHPDIQVTPLSGKIPADGTVNVVVTFKPTRHRTARAELQFVVSQFDFEPVPLTVCGSCPPDLLRDSTIMAARPEIEAAMAEATALPDKPRPPTEKRPARKDTSKAKPPTFRFEMEERNMGGVKVPVAPMTQTNANFVLGQTVGKIPMKDLPLFIKGQREMVESRQRRAEERHAAGKEGDDASEDDDEDRQALELQFELAFREVEKKDKERELKSMVAASGEKELTQEGAEREQAARRKREEKLKEDRLQRDVARADTVLSKPVVAVPEGLRVEQAPRWDEGENDTELLRQQVTDRFVRAGSRCLARVRARRRCNLLREAMRINGAVDRGSCRAWVETENKSAAAGAGKGQEVADGKPAAPLDTTDAGAGGEPVEQEEPGEPLDVVHIPSSGFVLPVQLPTATSGAQPEERLPVEVSPLDDFQEFLPVKLNARLDYKVLRYECLSVPPPAAYLRLHTDDVRLQAALEELPVRGPRGDELDGAEVAIAMPESCLLAPEHDPMSLLVPSCECRTYIPLPDYAECDPEFRLAQPAPLIGDLETELLLPHGIPSVDTPWLAAWRRTRQLPDPFRLFDPEPASFAEAGGQRGPRLGGDAGGERLSFMPIGGLPFDLRKPDEGDEERQVAMPSLGNESYEAARSATADRASKIDVDMWRKDRAAEARLRTEAAARGEAVRERLGELNGLLRPRNKLFLG